MQRLTVQSKLVLPTVETCPYRRQISADEYAQCELLKEISGVADAELCQVSSDACRACCESFPPTAASWNGVVTSLVYELSDRVIRRGGIAGCSCDDARRLRQAAVEILETVPSPKTHIIPVRTEGTCCYLGYRLSADSDAIAVESGEAEWRYLCDHPSHSLTTHERCRSCRDWSPRPLVSRRLSLREIVPPSNHQAGPKVHNWSIGVLTAPRREPTLEWCLDSLMRAGWNSPYLFVDGQVRIPPRYQHLPLTWRERPVGAWPNYYLALSELVQREPAADAYFLLQDDAVLYDHHDVRRYLEAMLWPSDRGGFVSLYCPQPYTTWKPGWHELAQPWVWGALAFVFPRDLARELIGSHDVIAHRWLGSNEGKAQVDVLIGAWAQARGHSIQYPCPSLVQHVGNTSSIWRGASNQGLRHADWYAGDIDAPFSLGQDWSQFPEELFPCRAELFANYKQRVVNGRERMSKCRVVIAGLCRNVRHWLPRSAARIERLGQMFQDYHIVLFENDSSDSTLEYLRDWQKQNARVHFQSQRLGRIQFPSIRSAERATQLAEYRNCYRRYALERFGDFDYMIVVDTDLAGGWSFDGIANSIGHDDWDVVGSYGLLRVHSEQNTALVHYDAWAFRALGHPTPHSNQEVNAMHFDRGEPLLPVFSSFGGLAVYRMEAMRAAEYSGPDCEHVQLHHHMREAGFDRQFLNASQIVLYAPD